MTAESIAADLLPVLNDNDIKVRQNIYEALLLKEFDRNIDFKLEAEEPNNNFKEN